MTRFEHYWDAQPETLMPTPDSLGEEPEDDMCDMEDEKMMDEESDEGSDYDLDLER